MKAIELEAAIARFGSSPAEIHLCSQHCIAPAELISVCAGKHPTLWISSRGEDLFLDVAQVETVTELRPDFTEPS